MAPTDAPTASTSTGLPKRGAIAAVRYAVVTVIVAVSVFLVPFGLFFPH